MTDDVMTLADLEIYVPVDRPTLLKWIRNDWLLTEKTGSGKGTRHLITVTEATVAELMALLVDAGITTETAAHAARGMILAGPTANDIYTWRARLTQHTILTIETLNPRFPLARARSSD